MFYTNKLKDYYEFENEEEVNDFLSNHAYLMEILYDAPTPIHNVFGNDVKLVLELVHYIDDDDEELFIIIKSHYDAETAAKLNKELFYKWFVNVEHKANGCLNFDEEPA